MLAMCASTVFGARDRRSQIAWFERPSAISARTSRSRSVRSSSGTRARRRPTSWATTSGSITEPPFAIRRIGVGEVVEVVDPVLEQVADAARTVGHQAQRERRLDVLRQDEDADVRAVLGADRLRRPEALVGVGRRHPDVDDRDVRAMLADGLQERVGVAGLGDDLEAGLGQQPRDPLAQQERVVGEDEPQGHARLEQGPDAPRRTARPWG